MVLANGIQRILAYGEPVDMRQSFDGLLGLVKGVLTEAPLWGSLFHDLEGYWQKGRHEGREEG